ncbi:hypothetical protein D9M68_997240 [compost metagenome]
MHPMFLPKNLYSFDDTELNTARVKAFCEQIERARNWDDYELMTQKAHWMLCAYWHAAGNQFDEAQALIREALDAAEDRIGGAA